MKQILKERDKYDYRTIIGQYFNTGFGIREIFVQDHGIRKAGGDTGFFILFIYSFIYFCFGGDAYHVIYIK